MEIKLPYDNNLRINKLEKLLDEKVTVASYKLFWLDAILKEIIVGNKEITFKRLACRMIATAWYPLVEFKLSFGVHDNLGEVVNKIKDRYEINKNPKEEDLIEFLENKTDKEVEKDILSLCNMVPYRLLSPFYENQLKGLDKSQKNRRIIDLSNEDEGSLYKIDITNSSEKKIIVNDLWAKYIESNERIIYGWIRYKLICFLQKRNPNVPAIAFKLEAPIHRNLKAPTDYWKLVNKEIGVKDIYTGQIMNEENYERYGVMSIDHFIPWSFVLHDELWNLIPTFKNINSKKSDNLPDLDRYFNDFCELQFKSFDFMRKNEKGRKILEDYNNINLDMSFNKDTKLYEPIKKEIFISSIEQTIKPLYQIAYNQGFNIWENNFIDHKNIEVVADLERV
ncbi:HNH endonuclease domain-containing protein [Clostridium sardiniense]|uniref:HNH endonuclease domain-containing protein n=1 Tax=Clostridium sardiniense TaxID=29369 RepID=UPI003D3451E1